MNPKSPQSAWVIFDLDGTIIHSEKIAMEAISDSVKELAPVQLQKLDPNFFNELVGRPFGHRFDEIIQKHQIKLSIKQFSEYVDHIYKKKLETNLPTIPGVETAIKELSKFFPLGLVSGSTHDQVLWALNKLNLTRYFKVIYGKEDYEKGKPAPDGFLKAIKTLNAIPTRTVIFEDSEAGIKSAKGAGAYVVAVKFGNDYGLNQSEAHQLIEDFNGLTGQKILNWLN